MFQREVAAIEQEQLLVPSAQGGEEIRERDLPAIDGDLETEVEPVSAVRFHGRDLDVRVPLEAGVVRAGAHHLDLEILELLQFRQDLGGELRGLDAAELPPVGPLGPGPSDRLTHPFLPLWVPAASAFVAGCAGAEREHPAGFEIAEGP